MPMDNPFKKKFVEFTTTTEYKEITKENERNGVVMSNDTTVRFNKPNTLIDEILADIKISAKLEIETRYIRDRIAEKLSGFHRDKIKEIGGEIEAKTNSPWEKSHLKAAVIQAICNYDEKRGRMI